MGHDVVAIGYGNCYCDCGAAGCCEPSLVSASAAAAQQLLLPTLSQPALKESSSASLELSTRTFRFEGFTDELAKALRAECCRLVEISKETFWLSSKAIGSDSRDPRNLMEAIAAQVFQHHTAGLPSGSYSEEASGAEFWTQVKPIDTGGGVDLHYDKDEMLAEAFGLGVFPQISTVTYLDDISNVSGRKPLSPTIIFPNKITDEVGSAMTSAVISHPAPCKHIAFDGRLLHGAPAHPSLRLSHDEVPTGASANSAGQRVTFLVNIWLNHKPSGVAELDADVAAQTLMASSSSNEQRSALTSNIRIVPAPAVATAVVKKFSGRIALPFLSRSATWEKEEGEVGLVLSMCAPDLKGELAAKDIDTLVLNFAAGDEAFLVHEDELLDKHPGKRVRKRPASALRAMKRPATSSIRSSKQRKRYKS